MRSYTIFFVALIAIASASQFRRTLSAAKHMEALAEIDKSPLTNMILSQIQIHFAAEGAVQDLLDVVQGFIDTCNENQREADATRATEQATCDREISGNRARSDEAAEMRDVAIQTIADNEKMLADNEVAYDETLANIEDLRRMLAEGQALRDEQKAEYDADQARKQKALDALSEALKLVRAFYASPGSFVQLSTKIEETTQKLQDLEESFSSFEFYKPIVQSLIQLAAGSHGSDAVGEIIDLLQKLHDQILDEKNRNTAVENTRVAEWGNLKTHLTTQLNNAIDRKGSLENAMANNKQVIEINEQVSVLQDAEHLKFEGLFDAWTNTCNAQAAAYASFTSQNQSDLGVLTKLLNYLDSNLSTVEDYLVQRVDA